MTAMTCDRPAHSGDEPAPYPQDAPMGADQVWDALIDAGGREDLCARQWGMSVEHLRRVIAGTERVDVAEAIRIRNTFEQGQCR